MGIGQTSTVYLEYVLISFAISFSYHVCFILLWRVFPLIRLRSCDGNFELYKPPNDDVALCAVYRTFVKHNCHHLFRDERFKCKP
jgi:hypothetical protein